MRWTATVTYSTDTGPNPVVFDFMELYELHDLVEKGPHWDTIVDISIKKNSRDPFLTVEEAITL